MIVEAMIQDMNEKHGREVPGVDPGMLQRLMQYDWPGNVRELRNTIERAVILCGSNAVGVQHLPPGFGSRGVETSADTAVANTVKVEVGTTVDEAERLLIVKTLASTNNNKTRAAEILGISLKTLHNKLKEYSQSRLRRVEPPQQPS